MKQITIIGGGISGLSTLHYLKQKYHHRDDVLITLLEKNDFLGGTIRTTVTSSYTFEHGANGFLDSKDSTIQLAKELGLEGELLPSNEEAKQRFLSLKNKLYELPSKPQAMFFFAGLVLLDKLRLSLEIFMPKGKDPEESVYAFGKRRLGENFFRVFLDPMVSGIFGGDAEKLNLKAAFPKIYEIEQKYGSLMKGMLALAKEKKRRGEKKNMSGQPGGTLTSFNKGMAQLIQTLSTRYQENIFTDQDVQKVSKGHNGFVIKTTLGDFKADELYVCVPAYVAAKILKPLSGALSESLAQMPYAPLAVVGLVYKRLAFSNLPGGFGYLIPSSEGKNVLGVLFDSNIFPKRSDQEHFLVRVMIGGARHPEVISKAEDYILGIAETEVRAMFSPEGNPVQKIVSKWPQAIPQYNVGHEKICEKIQSEITKLKGLHLVANYWGGVSLNDCVKNAKREAQKIVF